MTYKACRSSSAWMSVLVLCSLLAGCGSGHAMFCVAPCTGGSGGEFLFAGSASGEVLSAPIDSSTGALGSFTSVPGPAKSLGLAVSGTQFLYASDLQNAQLFGYSISASGTLSALSGSPFRTAATGTISLPGGLAATGNFLYMGDVAGVDGFSLSSTGIPAALSGSPFPSGAGERVAVSPSGKFLYQTDSDAPNGVFAFTIDSSGGLANVAGSPFPVPGPLLVNGNPFGVVVDGSGQFVYESVFANDEIAAWSINQTTGALTPVPGAPFVTGVSPASMVCVNKFLYVLASGSVYAYNIDAASGMLTAVNGSPFFVGATAGMAIDSSGKYLYAAAGAAGIYAFVINADGSLTAVSGSPFPATMPMLLATVKLPG